MFVHILLFVCYVKFFFHITPHNAQIAVFPDESCFPHLLLLFYFSTLSLLGFLICILTSRRIYFSISSYIEISFLVSFGITSIKFLLNSPGGRVPYYFNLLYFWIFELLVIFSSSLNLIFCDIIICFQDIYEYVVCFLPLLISLFYYLSLVK